MSIKEIYFLNPNVRYKQNNIMQMKAWKDICNIENIFCQYIVDRNLLNLINRGKKNGLNSASPEKYRSDNPI